MKKLLIITLLFAPSLFAADLPIVEAERLSIILGTLAPYYQPKLGTTTMSYTISVDDQTLEGNFTQEYTTFALATQQVPQHWQETPGYKMLELLYTISERSANKRRSSLPCITEQAPRYFNYISTRGSLDDNFIDYVDYDPFSGSYAGNCRNGTIDITYGGTWQNAHGQEISVELSHTYAYELDTATDSYQSEDSTDDSYDGPGGPQANCCKQQ